MLIFLTIILITIVLFLNFPLFGKHPTGERRKRIDNSPNFKKGEAQNLIPTPQLTDGYTLTKVMKEYLFGSKKNVKPKAEVPHHKMDLHAMDLNQDAFIWLGHSSYFVILQGQTFLIDPVLTNNAAPIFGSNKAFEGTSFLDFSDIPNINYLLITHDHYDHLDYKSIKRLKPKIKNVICGLGVGSHLEHWGYTSSIIKELDWWQDVTLIENIKITATPTRHFSGRTFFHKNNTLFCSYVLESANRRLLIGGDSGYGPHFKMIGDKFGPFDLIFLENGQYNKAWHYIHLHPEETLQAIEDLKAHTIMPVHHSKFALSSHDWKDPMNNVIRIREQGKTIVMPMIGEYVKLDNLQKEWPNWWEEVK